MVADTTDPTIAARAAVIAANMHADELFAKWGKRGDIQIVAPATYVVTVRSEHGIHVVAGTAKECIEKLEGE